MFTHKSKGFIFVFIWGDVPLGKVDIVKQRFYVSTMFFHIMGMILAPLASYVVRLLPEGKKEYYRIPLNWRSVIAGYLRSWLFAFLFITIFSGIIGWCATSDPLWILPAIANVILFILSLVLFRMPSEYRIVSHLKTMGIEVESNSMVADVDEWLNTLGCEKVTLLPSNVYGKISLICGLLGFVIPLLDITAIFTGVYALRRGEPDRKTAKEGLIFGCIGAGIKLVIYSALTIKAFF